MLKNLFPRFSQAPVLRQDKRGRPFRVEFRPDGESAREALANLYEAFEPKGCAQGLPPPHPDVRRRWIEKLLRDGLNLTASAEGLVVGHASLLDLEPGRSCEYVVFVHQRWQDRGLGSALTEEICGLARELGYACIWLTVERVNRRAVHLYEKSGFRPVGPVDSEWEMVLEL